MDLIGCNSAPVRFSTHHGVRTMPDALSAPAFARHLAMRRAEAVQARQAPAAAAPAHRHLQVGLRRHKLCACGNDGDTCMQHSTFPYKPLCRVSEVDLESQVEAFMKRQAELESGGE